MEDEETRNEPAGNGWFRCQKRPNHYGERHYVDFIVGDYAWGYVPWPDEE